MPTFRYFDSEQFCGSLVLWVRNADEFSMKLKLQLTVKMGNSKEGWWWENNTQYSLHKPKVWVESFLESGNKRKGGRFETKISALNYLFSFGTEILNKISIRLWLHCKLEERVVSKFTYTVTYISIIILINIIQLPFTLETLFEGINFDGKSFWKVCRIGTPLNKNTTLTLINEKTRNEVSSEIHF